jgi:hypothetical protein
MGQDVSPSDIRANEAEAKKMEDALGKAKRDREAVLGEFNKMLKNLDGHLREMTERFEIALDRVRYHKVLQKEVELRKQGKRMASLEKDDDRRVKDFIGVVKREDVPKFLQAFKDFDNALKAVRNALK